MQNMQNDDDNVATRLLAIEDSLNQYRDRYELFHQLLIQSMDKIKPLDDANQEKIENCFRLLDVFDEFLRNRHASWVEEVSSLRGLVRTQTSLERLFRLDAGEGDKHE